MTACRGPLPVFCLISPFIDQCPSVLVNLQIVSPFCNPERVKTVVFGFQRNHVHDQEQATRRGTGQFGGELQLWLDQGGM